MGSDQSEGENDNDPSNFISFDVQQPNIEERAQNEEGNEEAESENSESDNSSDAKVIINLDYDEDDDDQSNDGKLPSIFPFPRYDYLFVALLDIKQDEQI